ncbi:hypothetical protein [Nesterenkonia halobia]|uniref:DUF559 domain-containing protein n=1 Tax=Nesterenkonia halobia TaxID=37922 RepID=A0ABP6RAK9_9MICC
MHALPQELAGRAFTAAAAAEHGVSRDRLTRSDVVALGSGVHAPRAFAERLDDVALLRAKAAALIVEQPGAWISHASAARLHGLWLPRALRDDPRLHLSRPAGPDTWTRRRGVSGHRVQVSDGDVVRVGGVPMSSPARAWLDVAGRCSEHQLIIMGDQLIRTPYLRYEGRSIPYATLPGLRGMLDDARGVPGRRRCLAALERMRVGADSVQETRLRLALVDAGLPEPALQVPAVPGDPFSPRADLGYPELKIAIQYEGETHFTPEQHRADQRRDNVFYGEGWTVLRVNVEDHRDGFAAIVAQVAALLAAR